jgi:hypothetical protein
MVRGEVRFWVVLAVVAGLSLVGATTAAGSPPNYNAAQAVCASSGGEMFDDFGDLGYGCRSVPNPTPDEVTRGAAVCENAYGGTFIIRPSGYVCSLS